MGARRGWEAEEVVVSVAMMVMVGTRCGGWNIWYGSYGGRERGEEERGRREIGSD